LQKLRRDSTFVHEKTLQGVQRVEESFEDSKIKAQEGQRFHTRSEAQVEGVRRERREAKVEAFENLKFFQVWEESAGSSGGAAQPVVRSAGEEIWTVDFYVQEELRRSLQKEETDSRRISLRNPVSRWIGRRCSEFSLWRAHKEEGSEPSDLEQIPVSRQIGQELHEV
jgi:hypothetical protein